MCVLASIVPQSRLLLDSAAIWSTRSQEGHRAPKRASVARIVRLTFFGGVMASADLGCIDWRGGSCLESPLSPFMERLRAWNLRLGQWNVPNKEIRRAAQCDRKRLTFMAMAGRRRVLQQPQETRSQRTRRRNGENSCRRSRYVARNVTVVVRRPSCGGTEVRRGPCGGARNLCPGREMAESRQRPTPTREAAASTAKDVQSK